MASKENELAIKIAGKIEKSFYNSTKLTKRELDNMVKHSNTVSKGFRQQFNEGFDQVSAGFDSMSKKAKVVFNAVGKAAKLAGIAVAAVTGASIMVGASFEEQMSTVKSISRATGTEFNALSDKAQEMGQKTKFSATEAGQAMEYMGMAGWKASDMIDGIGGIMNLAAASGEDLAIVSDIVTDSLTAFGLKAKDSAHFADILASAATNSNTNVEMMGETFKYAAPVAGALGYSAEDTAVAIGLMANSGIKASQAGTSLRKIFTATTSGIEVAGKAFAEAGKQTGKFHVETVNADGSMRELNEIIVDLRTAFSELTESEKAQEAEAIAGKTAMSGLLAIVNASDSDYQKLTESINNCTGAAEEMAAIRLDNLKGDAELLTSNLESMGIEIYKGLNEPLREVTQSASGFIEKMTTNMQRTNVVSELSNDFVAKLPTAKRYLKEFKTEFFDFANPFMDFGKWLIKNPNVVISTLAGIGSVIATYKVAKGVKSVATSFSSLAAILTNPFAASITAVGLAIGGTVGIATYIKNLNNELKKENLAEHFGSISLSMEDLQEAAAHIINTGVLSKMQQVMSEFDKKDTYFNSMNDAIQEINKANWKVSIGMELTDAEKESYLANVTQFISDTQNTLLQDQYSMKLAMDIYTQDNAEGDEVKTAMNGFYANLMDTVTEEAKKLADASSEAFEDGMLQPDEATVIANYMQEMANITEMISDAQFDAKLSAIQLNYSGAELTAESFQNLQSEIAEQVEAAKAAAEDSYVQTIAHFKVAFDAGDMDKSTYETAISQAKEQYLNDLKDIELKATDFQTDTIVQQYGEELSGKIPEFQKLVEDTMNSALERAELTGESLDVAWDTIITDSLMADYDGLDKSTQAAISQLFDLMKPSVESLQALKNQYRDAGLAIPDEINKALTDSTVLGAISENEEGLWGYIATQATNNPEYARVITTMQQGGSEIPKQVADAVENSTYLTTDAVKDLYNSVQKNATSIFSKGININLPMKLNANVTGNTPNTNNSKYGNKVYANAKGSIVMNPILTTFAEDGPEAAIPLDGSQNAINLWQTAGKMLGVYDDRVSSFQLANQKMNSKDAFSDLFNNVDRVTDEESNYNNSNQIVYSPNMNFNFNGGTPNKEDILAATSQSEQDFEAKMDRYFAQKSRKGFKDFSFS